MLYSGIINNSLLLISQRCQAFLQAWLSEKKSAFNENEIKHAYLRTKRIKLSRIGCGAQDIKYKWRKMNARQWCFLCLQSLVIPIWGALIPIERKITVSGVKCVMIHLDRLRVQSYWCLWVQLLLNDKKSHKTSSKCQAAKKSQKNELDK